MMSYRRPATLLNKLDLTSSMRREYLCLLRFTAATSSAGEEISTASTLARGNRRASNIARQADPVHKSRTDRTGRGSHDRRPLGRSSAMNERGTITRSSTKKRKPDNQASPRRYARGFLVSIRASRTASARWNWPGCMRVPGILRICSKSHFNEYAAIQTASSVAVPAPCPKNRDALSKRRVA